MDEKDSSGSKRSYAMVLRSPRQPPPPPAAMPNRKSYAGALNSPSPNRVTSPHSPGNTTPIPSLRQNTKPGTVASCSDAVTRAQAQPIVNVPELPRTSEKTIVSTFEKKGPVRVTFNTVTTEGSTSGSYPRSLGYPWPDTVASGSDAVTRAPPHLSSNSEEKGHGRVTFPFPTEISSFGSKKHPILFGTILAEIECPFPTYAAQPSPVIPRPSEQLAGTEGLPSFRSPKKAEIECSGQPVTPRPSEQLAVTPIPSSRQNTKPGTVASCSDAVTRAQAQPIVNVPELPRTSEKTTVSTSEKKGPVRVISNTVTTEGSTSGSYPKSLGYPWPDTVASGSDAVTRAPPHLSSNSEEKGPGRVIFPFPTEISSFGSKKYPILFGTILAEIECPFPTYAAQPSPVLPRPAEQLAGTEGLPTFRSPKKAEIECPGQPVTPRPSEQLAGTEGSPRFHSPKKRNPDAARTLYMTFSLWGPDISPEEIFLYFESIMGADTVEDISLFCKLDSEGSKTTDAFVRFRNSDSVEILMGEAEVVEMMIFDKTAHAKRHRD